MSAIVTGWRPGDLVRARYRLLAPADSADSFDALDELTRRRVEVRFLDGHSERISVSPARDSRPMRRVSEAFDQPGLPFPAPPAARPPRRRTRAVLAALVASSGLWLAWPRTPVVPELRGLSRVAAQRALAAAGLREGDVTTAFHPSIAVGAVIATDPAAGMRLVPHAPVGVRLSRGPADRPVPRVVGMSAASAREAVVNAGFFVRGTKQVPHAQAPGTVLDQYPKDTRARRGAPVDLVVSLGRRR